MRRPLEKNILPHPYLMVSRRMGDTEQPGRTRISIDHTGVYKAFIE